MLTPSELERADLLEMANLASALKKTIRLYQGSHRLQNHRYVLARGKNLVGQILAGSLRSSRDEVNKLLPQGAGLYESVRAYGYARQIMWPLRDSSSSGECEEGMFRALRCYAQCIDNIEQDKPFDSWSLSERSTLDDLVPLLSKTRR